jgi:hypothetical protein
MKSSDKINKLVSELEVNRDKFIVEIESIEDEILLASSKEYLELLNNHIKMLKSDDFQEYIRKNE